MGTGIKSKRGIFLLEIVKSFLMVILIQEKCREGRRATEMSSLGQKDLSGRRKGRQQLGTHKAYLFLQEMWWRRGVHVSYLRAGRSSLSYLH